MNLHKFKLEKEDENSYHILHPNGNAMQITKAGLTPKAHEMIQKLAEGGKVKEELPPQLAGYPTPEPENPTDPGQLPTQLAGYSGVPMGPPAPTDMPAAPAPEQAAPAAPAPAAPAPAPVSPEQAAINGVSPASIYSQGTQAIDIQQQAAANEGASKAAADIAYQKTLAGAQADYIQRAQDIQKKVDTTAQWLADPKNKEDAGNYLRNMDAGSKISTALGMLVAGFGAGITHQANPVVGFLNQQIDRDINSQRQNIGTQKTLLGAYQNEFHDMNAAEAMTRATQLGVYQAQLQQYADQATSPMSKAGALQAKAALGQQMLPLIQRAHALEMAAGGGQAQPGTPQGLNPVDPASLVAHLQIPDADRKQVFEEIKNSQDIKTLTPKIMKAFDDASNAGLAKTIPGMESSGQKEFSGLMNTTVKEQEGTARQAAFDSIQKNMRPQFGDSKDTLAKKKQLTLDYLGSKAAAPTAKGYGLNLQNFASTAVGNEPQIKIVNGVKYMRGPHGEAIRVK